MKIVFISNFLNHHVLSFCKKMDTLTNHSFIFVATEPINQMRLDLGYHDMNDMYAFVYCVYKDGYEQANKIINNADVVICGAPYKYIKERVKQNKLTFIYSERILKNGLFRSVSVRGYLETIYGHYIRNKSKNLYLLCSSSYAAGDFNALGAFKGKTYKWGYFPETRNYDIEELYGVKRKNNETRLLWSGRLIGWKNPDVAIYIAKRLKEDNIKFHLNFIGVGELENSLIKEIEENFLQDDVTMLGAMSPEMVRKYMEYSDIFLFTSDYSEGWGAVLNESMNSGCAVVANRGIGAVGFLIKDGENGLVYDNGDLETAYKKVKLLIADQRYREMIGANAYNTIISNWNGEKAAERLMQLSQALLNDQQIPFVDGPCSIAIPHKFDNISSFLFGQNKRGRFND